MLSSSVKAKLRTVRKPGAIICPKGQRFKSGEGSMIKV